MVKKRNELLIQSRNAQRRLTDKEKYFREIITGNCDHEFIIYAKANKKHDEIIECVHCGLTNKYTLYESFLNQKLEKRGFMYDIYYNEDGKVESFETKLFNHEMKDKKRIPYFSDQELRCDHINFFYQLALNIADDPNDNMEVFEIIKTLDLLKEDLNLMDDEKGIKKLLREYRSIQKQAKKKVKKFRLKFLDR